MIARPGRVGSSARPDDEVFLRVAPADDEGDGLAGLVLADRTAQIGRAADRRPVDPTITSPALSLPAAGACGSTCSISAPTGRVITL